jgi:hypothetical protein
MKYLIFLVLFLLSFLVHAEPTAHYQIDGVSKVAVGSIEQPLSGFVRMSESFAETQVVLMTDEGLFESTEITGDKDHFEVKGLLISKTEKKPMSLFGSNFGVIQKAEGVEKVFMKLSSEHCVAAIVASRPLEAVTSLHRNVRDIIK